MKRNLGFTLIEMLVVVAIILVLGAILFPALNKAKESGRNARCSSNLRQLQLATINYACGGGFLPSAESYVSVKVDGSKTHVHGWVAWCDVFGSKDTDGSTGSYGWFGALGYASITNGALWGQKEKKL